MRVDKLWTFSFIFESDELAALTISPRIFNQTTTMSHFHLAAAHINRKYIKEAISEGRVTIVRLKSDGVEPEHVDCVGCIVGKMDKGVLRSHTPYLTKVGELIHADIRFFEVPSVSGYTMALMFQDGLSNFIWFYPMKRKDAETVVGHWTYLVKKLQSPVDSRSVGFGRTREEILPTRKWRPSTSRMASTTNSSSAMHTK